MSGQSPEDYRKRQREFYESNAGGWDVWAASVAEQSDSFNNPLIAAAGITEGMKILDLASGAGEPALSVARLVGPTGHVTASDLSPAMLAIAEARAKESGLANMEFKISEIDEMVFDDDAFDAVICRFGIMYSPEPKRALAEARRVTRSGGRVAFMVWGPIESNTILWTVLDVGNRMTGHFDGDELEHPFCYAEPGSLKRFFEGAGLTDLREEDHAFAPRIPKSVPFWQPLIGMNFGGALATMSGQEKSALEDAIAAGFAPCLKDDKYHVSAHVRLISGACP
ncbi:MAG: class I SAM-dependent methyltransferase [Alphaproteobacteria bacterium]|nr:class I SAM-dependent methyltransferase [Alphaproteobacteria bacterium]